MSGVSPRRCSLSPSHVTRGLLFVHGVGSQRQSDMLLNAGNPLLEWLTRWYMSRSEAPRASTIHYDAMGR